jgi:hypothetical protein
MNFQEDVKGSYFLQTYVQFLIRFNRLINGKTNRFSFEFTMSMIVEIDEILRLSFSIHVYKDLAGLFIFFRLVHYASCKINIVT